MLRLSYFEQANNYYRKKIDTTMKIIYNISDETKENFHGALYT